MWGGQWGVHPTQPQFARVADLLIAAALIALVLPLMSIVAIAIKCNSQGPVLVWARRRGPAGGQFWTPNFRCTAPASSARPNAQLETTFVGGIIRYLRIDTLPQLINVLRGEMTCLSGAPDCPFFLE
jgi:lipopolysaccharide/colanic/teichoic acid biosynthesis glycosyltransferase